MSKSILAILLFIWSISSVHSQNANLSVISTVGDDLVINGTQLSWTIGEVLASSSKSNSTILNEGFIQTEPISVALSTVLNDRKVTIYPNPTTDFLILQPISGNDRGSYQLTSLRGETLLKREQVDFSKENTINMLNLSRGAYVLIIKIKEHQTSFIKIIKN